MLNIPSKNELQKKTEENHDEFLNLAKEIIKKHIKRDKKIMKDEILPKLQHAVALTHFLFNYEDFHFTLPYMNFEGYEFTEEEKEKIVDWYYSISYDRRNESIMGILKKSMKKSAEWIKADIEPDKNIVRFTVRLPDHRRKTEKVEETEEFKLISSKLDEYVLPHFNFEKIAERINACYQQLTTDNLVAVFDRDLESYPIFSLQMDAILRKTKFFSEVQSPDPKLKIDIREYLNRSEYIKELTEKMKQFGYELHFEYQREEKEVFRYRNVHVRINANFDSKVQEDTLISSEQLRKAFYKQKEAYDVKLNHKAMEQNDTLIQLVKNGYFDEMVATKWTNATLMSSIMITRDPFYGDRFMGDRFKNEMDFHFFVPFKRTITGVKKFERSYYVGDGVGTRYINMENNIIDALKERYPFLQDSEFFGGNQWDYQGREGSFNSDSFRADPKILTFGFHVNKDTYVKHKNNILQWLISYHGPIHISSILEKIGFHAEGISQKLHSYTQEQNSGGEFEIVIGTVRYDDIIELYRNSPLYEATKKVFEGDHEKEFWCHWRATEEFKEAKVKKYQSIHLGNVFLYELFTNPIFEEMKNELATHDYKLNVRFVKEEKRNMKTGSKNLPGDDMFEDVCVYSVQIVIE